MGIHHESILSTLSYAERSDYLPDCIVIVILGGIISVEWIGLSMHVCCADLYRITGKIINDLG